MAPCGSSSAGPGPCLYCPQSPARAATTSRPSFAFREDALRAWLAEHLADLLALAGAACCVRGLFLLASWIGWLGTGLLLLAIAYVGSRAEPRRTTP